MHSPRLTVLNLAAVIQCPFYLISDTSEIRNLTNFRPKYTTNAEYYLKGA